MSDQWYVSKCTAQDRGSAGVQTESYQWLQWHKSGGGKTQQQTDTEGQRTLWQRYHRVLTWHLGFLSRHQSTATTTRDTTAATADNISAGVRCHSSVSKCPEIPQLIRFLPDQAKTWQLVRHWPFKCRVQVHLSDRWWMWIGHGYKQSKS